VAGRRWNAALGLALALLASAARGEDPVHRADDIVVQEETLRPAEIFQDTPVETEIVTDQEVQELPAQNAAQVVDKLPGIRVTPRVQGEEAAVSIEGMPPEYTKILVDGQRYTGEIGAVNDLRDVPIENAQRVEILRGTQALRHGTDAGGGVINLIRREPPSDGFRFDADGGAGNQGNYQGSGTAAWGNEKVGGSVSFDHDEIAGFDAEDDLDAAVLVGGNSDSRRISRDANGQLVLRPAEPLTLRSRVGWRREDETLFFDDQILGSSQRDEKRWLAGQEAEWQVTPSTRLETGVSWFRWDQTSEVGRDFDLEEDEWKLDAAVEQFLETGALAHALTLGVDARWQGLDLAESGLPDVDDATLLPTTVNESFQETGIFLIDETELTHWFSVEVGGRAQFHQEFGSRVIPQAALLLKPVRNLKLRLSWGQNYRTPSLRDLYEPPVAQLGGAYFLAGNPELSPESSTSYRAGFEFTPYKWVSLSAVGFWNDIDDHIRSVTAGSFVYGSETRTVQVPAIDRPGLDLICELTGNFFPECALLGATISQVVTGDLSAQLFRKQNLDSVRTRGVEARLELRPWRFFELHLGYTYMATRVIDSTLIDLDELPNEPHHVVDGRVRLEAPETETALVVRARWRDRALVERSGTGLLGFTQPEYSDPSLIVDARLAQPLGENFEVYVDGYNLTDEEVVDSIAVRGRGFLVGVRIRYGGGKEQ
jgi:outer membrane receptor for ferrienterochelin and colicins